MTRGDIIEELIKLCKKVNSDKAINFFAKYETEESQETELFKQQFAKLQENLCKIKELTKWYQQFYDIDFKNLTYREKEL